MDAWIFLSILFITSIVQGSVVQISHTSSGQYTFIVPNWVRSVNMILTGASGGTAYSGSGGFGAIVNTTLTVTPGVTYYIFVGGAGTGNSAPSSTPRAGGFNGGGESGLNEGVGGGGSTDFRSTTDPSTRIVVAGGGGGGTKSCAVNGNGGNGGLTGSTPPSGPCASIPADCPLYSCPSGATQSAGGSGGTCFSGYAGTAGTVLTGGAGAQASGSGGGGGGGGYYGGGGGFACGGSGGSSYCSPSFCSTTTYKVASTSGDGSAKITYENAPTSQPTLQPRRQPSKQPSTQPTKQPSQRPSNQPSKQPSSEPSQPSRQPSMQPTMHPSIQPSNQPSLNHPHSLRINQLFNQLFSLQVCHRGCQRNSLLSALQSIQARNRQRRLPFSRLASHLAHLQSNLRSIHQLSHLGNLADGLRFSQRPLQLPSHLVSLSTDPHRNHPDILLDVLLTVHRVALRNNLTPTDRSTYQATPQAPILSAIEFTFQKTYVSTIP